MGTKVHCKTFLPEHCTAGEVNVDGTSGWPIYYEDRALSMQFCNGLASMLIGCPGYEKEVLKQTMLKHEAIFRTQVYELHRLYRIQRELTEELKRKDFCVYSTNVHPSQSSTISSKWNQQRTPYFPVASSSFSRPSSASIYNSQKTIKGFSTEAEASPVPSENSFWYNSDALNPEPKRPNSVVIDLSLPGDAYLDVESTKGVDTKAFTQKLLHRADLPNVNCKIKSQKDAMLSLVSSECDDGLQHQNMFSVLHNSSKSPNLSGSNKPIKPPSNIPLCQEGPAYQLDLFNQERKNSQVIQFEKGFPSFLEADGGAKRQKLWLSNHESGNTNDIDHVYGETAKKLAGYEQFKPAKIQESFSFALSNQSPSETSFKEKSRLNGTGKSLPANSICTVLAMPRMTCPVPSNTSCNNVNITIPLFTSFKDFGGRVDDDPVSDDQSTCFIGSTSSNKSKIEDMFNKKPASACDKQKSNFSISHSSGCHDSVPSNMKSSSELYLSISNSDKQNVTVHLAHQSTSSNMSQLPVMGLQSNAGNPVKDIDLNLALPGDFSDIFSQQNVASVISDAREEHDLGSSWLKSNTIGDHPASLSNTSQTALFTAKGYSALTNNMMLQDLNIDNVRNSFLPGSEQPQKEEISSVPCYNKLFGVPVLESSSKGTITDLYPAGSPSKKNRYELESQLPAELVFSVSDKSSATGGRTTINLNSLDSFTDCVPKSSDNLAAADKISVISSESGIAGKSPLVIDLELPAEPFGEEPTASKVALEDHLHAPFTLTTDTKECRSQEDTITKMAAETIVKMSSKICEHSGSISSLSLDQISAGNLHWFADVVSSHIGASDSFRVPSTGEADGREGLGNDGLDFLEAMTLNLVETNVDDLLPTIPDKENRKEETSSISPCLLTKARRGQARRRRQRRDFQKDVLPGLASLSRHEVSEDIQIIGGMMQAVGQPWQSGVARRTRGRNAGGCQAKGRRRQRGGSGAAAVPVALEVPVESQPRKANFAEFEMDARSIMGWGRTRRCRRPRCPPGISVPPALS